MGFTRASSSNFYSQQKFNRIGLASSAAIVQARVSATGGTVVTTGGFKYHTFTGAGTLTVVDGGAVEVLLVGGGAGGGGGGGDEGWGGYTRGYGGGGGGGGVKLDSVSVNGNSTVVVTIGGGKLGGPGATNTVSGPKFPIPTLHVLHPALQIGYTK